MQTYITLTDKIADHTRLMHKIQFHSSVKGTVIQIEKALINDLLYVSKLS